MAERRVAVVTGGAVRHRRGDHRPQHGHRAGGLHAHGGQLGSGRGPAGGPRPTRSPWCGRRRVRCWTGTGGATCWCTRPPRSAGPTWPAWTWPPGADVQAVNVESALLLAQAFAPGMAARGFGRIIFVVSNTVWAPPARVMSPVRDQQGSAGRAGPDARGRARRRRDRGDLRGPRLTATPTTSGTCRPPRSTRSGSRQALPRTLVPRGRGGHRWRSWPPDEAAALTGQTLCTDGGLILR